jgi:hypothetical protein
MVERRELTLTLHGLDAFNEDVDGEVFAKKLTAFLNGIRLSDKAVNGRRRHKLLLTELRKGSAVASVREQVFVPGPPPGSGMSFYEEAIEAVYHKRPEAKRLPLPLLKSIDSLNRGSGHSFAFGELKSSTGIVIRIDDYLGRIARSLVSEAEAEKRARPVQYSGMAFAFFDGVLKLVDLRGDLWRGVLVLTAGGKQIECTVNALAIPDIRDALDHRVTVYGRAHYSGASGLPERLEITSAKPVREPTAANLARWRGAFNLRPADVSEDWH